jgi:hypothetical protein
VALDERTGNSSRADFVTFPKMTLAEAERFGSCNPIENDQSGCGMRYRRYGVMERRGRVTDVSNTRPFHVTVCNSARLGEAGLRASSECHPIFGLFRHHFDVFSGKVYPTTVSTILHDPRFHWQQRLAMFRGAPFRYLSASTHIDRRFTSSCLEAKTGALPLGSE